MLQLLKPTAMTTTIDVAIPCYRYGSFLRQCVESVLSQVDVNVRVLILDDASPDNSAEIGRELARLDSRVEFRHHAANKGHIATYNEGIEWAAADLFLLLSADDYLLPGAFSRAAKLMATAPDLSFVFGAALLLFDDGTSAMTKPFHRHSDSGTAIWSCLEFIKTMNGRNIVPTPTAIVRTSAQKRVGGYRNELPHAGDMAMWLRLAAEGPVGFISAPQGVYRIHSTNMSRSYSSARLPDIEQRRVAIEHFFEHVGGNLSRATLLRAMLLRGLAGDATRQACSAFNDGDIEISQQLARLAQELHPGIRRTAPWLRLMIRRALGQKAWSALRSTFRGDLD